MAEFSSFNGYAVKDVVARGIAKGRNQAVSYSDYSSMIEELNAMDKDQFRTGQNIYIGTVDVPDLWVYTVEPTLHTFNYVSDEEVTTLLENNVTIQVGYYKLAMLEGQKVDLTTYDEEIKKIKSETVQLNPKIAIPEGADLDDYHDIGSYRCNSAIIAETLLNCPHKSSGFNFYVSRPTGGSSGEYRRQTIETAGTAPRTIVRTYNVNDEKWNDWIEEASIKYVEKAIADMKESLDAEVAAIKDMFEQKAEVDDLDKATRNGFYRYLSSAENKPSGANVGGCVFVIGYSETYFTQIAFPNTSDNSVAPKWRRHGTNGYTSWETFAVK